MQGILIYSIQLINIGSDKKWTRRKQTSMSSDHWTLRGNIIYLWSQEKSTKLSQYHQGTYIGSSNLVYQIRYQKTIICPGKHTVNVTCCWRQISRIKHKILFLFISWWRHLMKIFSALLAICVGNSPVTGEFLAQRPVTRSFDVFFDLCLNKPLSKQWWGWWFDVIVI